MKSSRPLRRMLVALSFVVLSADCIEEDLEAVEHVEEELNPTDSNEHQYDDPTGTFSTYSTAGVVHLTSPFFVSLGTNGRTCFSCHQLDQGWSITPAKVQERFTATAGTDPIFRTNDGSNSPLADVSTESARQSAYSMLLSRGVIRVSLPIPPGAEFTLSAVDDPYGYASASALSLFRRPLPSVNLRFITTVMWDGRENIPGGTIDQALLNQANGATLGHAQSSTSITAAQARAIVDFEMGITLGQHKDVNARDLAASGSNGGLSTPARFLSVQPTYLGINAPLGDFRTGAPFNPAAFNIYDIWATSLSGTGQKEQVRRAILRGQNIFNTKTFTITGVRGLNDAPEFGSPATLVGTCSTCHSVPNAGNFPISLPMDIGVTAATRRAAVMPLYTLRRTSTGETRQTTDPGLALITGRWNDIGRFKVPTIRGLSSRAPYFHDGSAASLNGLIGFYIGRFGIVLTADERADLLVFLQSL